MSAAGEPTPPGLPRGPLILLAAAGGASLLAHLFCALSPFDDAYIIFRYVDHLLEGRGLVYNDGQRVFGVSCPLYLGWLALLHVALPGVGLPELAVRANALLLLAAGALAFLLALRLGATAWISASAGSAVMIAEGILRASVGGMESAMFVALLFGSLLALAARRDLAAVTMASLATLTRPEGVVLLGVVLGAAWLDPASRSGRLRPLPGLLPLILWAAAATAWYGTPIPHSVLAKSRPLYPLPAGAALGYLLTQTGRWTLDGLLSVGLTVLREVDAGSDLLVRGFPVAVYRCAGVLLSGWALWRWGRAGVSSLPVRQVALPAVLLLVAALYAITNPLLLPWYLPLVHAPWIVAALTAASPGREEGRFGPPARRAALLLVTLTAAASFVHHMSPSSRSLIQHGGTDLRQQLQMGAYARAAGWLSAHSDPGASVAAAEIGILGYRLDRRILDACGLVSPEALPFLPPPPEQRGGQLGPITVGLVQTARPDYVVFIPAFAERSLLASAWFAQAYVKVHEEEFLPEDPRYRAVLIYRRRA